MRSEMLEPRVSDARTMMLVGSENQRERWEAGLLPRQELLYLARERLFAPFARLARWRKLEIPDVRHAPTCQRGEVRFGTRAPLELTHGEWANYRTILGAFDRELASPAGALSTHGVTGEVVVVEHYGLCSVCRAEVIGCAASIRLEWAGLPLSREYLL